MGEDKKHFHLNISSGSLLLRGLTKTTLRLYRIDFRCASKRLYICIVTNSICIKTTCIEKTLYRNDRTPNHSFLARESRNRSVTSQSVISAGKGRL